MHLYMHLLCLLGLIIEGEVVCLFNPNLSGPVNFVPYGTMRCSIFDINLMSITCI